MPSQQIEGILLDRADADALASALQLLPVLFKRAGAFPSPAFEAFRLKYLALHSDSSADATNTAMDRPIGPGPAQRLSHATVTTSQAASILGCSVANVRARAARGTLPAHRVGDRWRFDLADLERAAKR